MNLAKRIFVSLSLIPFVFHVGNTFANETYVFCSDNNKNWNWLGNGKVKVNGTWKHASTQSVNFYKYFILDEGIAKYNSLKSQCLTEFGPEFIYPQPSDSYFSGWSPFAKNDNEILPGIITYIVVEFQIRQFDKQEKFRL